MINCSVLVSAHLDTPAHSIEGGWNLDQIPTNDLISIPAVMIDVSDKVTTPDGINSNYAINKVDLVEYV